MTRGGQPPPASDRGTSSSRGGQPPPVPDEPPPAPNRGESSNNSRRRARNGRKRATPDAAHAEGEADDGNEDSTLPFADDHWREDLGADQEWWEATCSGTLRSLIRNFQGALRSATCYQGHPVGIAALPSPMKCAQCLLTLSMTQYTGRCDLCSLICLQCLFNVNRQLTRTGKLDATVHLELEFVGESGSSDPFVMWNVDKMGAPLENRLGSPRYSYGRLAYRLLLNSDACDLTVDDFQWQRAWLGTQRGWTMLECKQAGWYAAVLRQLELVASFYDPHYLMMVQPSERSVLLACQGAEIWAMHWQEELDEGGSPAPSQRWLLSMEELEGKELLPRPEPYGQAGVQVVTTMRMAREIDAHLAMAMESQYWDTQEAEDLCFELLCQVRDDTEA